MQNPEINEATAVAIVQILDNQIAALQAWKRKLTRPFMPDHRVTYIHLQVPPAPMPTLGSLLQINISLAQGTLELKRVIIKFLEERKEKS